MNVHDRMAENKPLLSGACSVLPRFSGPARLQIAAQPGGQQLKHSVLGFLIIGQSALHHIFCIHDGRRKDMEPQQVLIDFVQTWKYPPEGVGHSDERFEIGDITAFVVHREKRAVPEAVIENGFVRAGVQNRK